MNRRYETSGPNTIWVNVAEYVTDKTPPVGGVSAIGESIPKGNLGLMVMQFMEDLSRRPDACVQGGKAQQG